MIKHRSGWKQITAGTAIALCSWISTPAIASQTAIAYSYLEIDNFQVFNDDTDVQLSVDDFLFLDIGNSSSASALSTFGAGVPTASINTLETQLACSGDVACPGIAENTPSQQGIYNFGRGDTSTNGGAIISGLPGVPNYVNVWTVAEGRQDETGWTTGQSGARTTTEFVLAADTTIRVDFDATTELYAQLDQPLVQAQSSYGWNASIINVDTGTLVFRWVPNGQVGNGITGGTELADDFGLNNSRGQLSTGSNGTGVQSGAFSATVALAANTRYRLSIGHDSQVNTEAEPVPVVTGGCRMTGGNSTVYPITAEDGTLTWSYEYLGPSDEDNGRVTTGGQINAPSGQQPPKGHWEHTVHDGPYGIFSFHAGTSSAPAGTEISSVECADPGWCVQARCAPFKQLFWTGIGNFANQRFDAAFPGCEVVKGNKGTLHFVKVSLGDFGENDRPTRSEVFDVDGNNECDWLDKLQAAGWYDNPNDVTNPKHLAPWTAADAVLLDSSLDPQFGDKNGQICDKCPDYYQIEIHCTTDPGSQVIYSYAGFLAGGNYQIHPETGEQCPLTQQFVPELFPTEEDSGETVKTNNGKNNR